MRSALFLGLCTIGYLLVILWIVIKLKDITKNPKKYNVINGWDAYKASDWYERKYKQYGNHYYACLYIGVPALFLFPVLYILLGSMLQNHLYLSDGGQRLSILGLGIGAIASMIYSQGIVQFLVFYGKKPMVVAARLYYEGREQHQPTAWENMFTWLLVLSLICLPVMTMGIYSCSYANEEKIVTRSLFSVTAQEIPYESIESGITTYSCDSACTEFSLEYTILLEDGSEVRVDKFEQGGVCYIDAWLRENEIPVTYGEIDMQLYERLKENCNDKDIELIGQYLKIVE